MIIQIMNIHRSIDSDLRMSVKILITKHALLDENFDVVYGKWMCESALYIEQPSVVSLWTDKNSCEDSAKKRKKNSWGRNSTDRQID